MWRLLCKNLNNIYLKNNYFINIMDFENIFNELNKNNILFYLNNIKYIPNLDKNILNRAEDLIIYFNNTNYNIKEKTNYSSNIKERLNNIDSIAFKKDWNKLSNIQKELKFNEYININYNQNDDIELIFTIKELFYKGKLNKKIEYSSKDGKIENIII
tara:strand:- start:781 stop:1254 length:474 start_codon:yes stop_codon:yes gene_type:complete